MTQEVLLWVILAIIVFGYLFESILDYLNVRSAREEMPDEASDIYDAEKYRTSIQYLKETSKFSAYTSTFSLLLTILVLWFGVFGVIDEYLRGFTEHYIALPLLFFAVIMIASDVINLPFQLYRNFVIEEKYGFNKSTLGIFFMDKLKGYLVGALLGGILFSALLLIVDWLGSDFWFVFWIVISIFILFMNMFYTTLIVPLFNKLTPLEDGELKSAINDYCKSVDFPLTNIFVIDGSKRSSKSNAFFSGLGKKKKIVLYDTLIENHSVEELVAVLAHEVGHYKKKHIIQGFVLSIAQTGLMLFILSTMIFNESLSSALGASEMGIHLNLIAFGLLYSPISMILGILMNLLSRKNEFEADAYAANTYKGSALIEALKRLASTNLSNLMPNKWYVFFNYSHPPLLVRMKAIRLI